MERVSFRWGVPCLDVGFVQLPNVFLDRYMEAGVTNEEFLLVVHLARFHYESSRGAVGVPLCMLADRMGVTVRTVQRWKRSLIEKGFLLEIARRGLSSIYDLSGLARVLMGGGDTGVMGGGDTGVRGGVTGGSPHENKEEEEQKEIVLGRLVGLGMPAALGDRLLARYGADRVGAVVRASSTEATRNRVGWVRAALEEGWDVAAGVEQLPLEEGPVVDNRWSLARDELQLVMTRGMFGRWVAGLELGAWESVNGYDRVRIVCPSEYVREWMVDRLDRLMVRTLGDVVGRPVRVEYVVEGGDLGVGD